MPASTNLEVLFTPADFATLKQRDLRETVCVVLDVLRATSTMVTALGNGAVAIIPVEEIPEALALRQRQPELLLAGEREGLRIGAELTGGSVFDLGNSPREFTADKVRDRTIVMTTTNGTRAMRACANARVVLIGAFLNLGATMVRLKESAPANLILVCSGTFEQVAYEDVLCAGALCELAWGLYAGGLVSDSAFIARQLFQFREGNLQAAFSESRNGRRLLSRPELRDDVSFCAAVDSVPLVAQLNKDGMVTRVGA
jgi:2-phosphosulfolactate phosphatase